MYSRATAVGILAAVALALPTLDGSSFTLRSTGAVALEAGGNDARYGVVSQAVRGGPIVVVSLGATQGAGALQLSVAGDRPPAPGRYPITSSWDELETDGTAFHASFMPGTAERPLGWFHGEAGWVTITAARQGRIAGTFEVRARGFAAADLSDEDRWVTVRGSFDAAGDSTTTKVASN